MTRSRDLADSADKDISGTLTLDDIVLSNDMTVADNGKVIFGAGSDLQIYHDGSNSYVDDAGTGRLYLRGNDRVQIQKYTGDDMITAIADGAVKLYYDNSNKLETTSSGVSVTGSVDAGAGLRLSTDGSNNAVITALGQDKDIYLSGDDGGSGVNALILDMSNAGAATFNSFIYLDYIRGKSDNNTGINISGSDVLAFQTGGSERVRLGSSGEMQLGGTTNAGFIDFDSSSLQLNTQRNPNTGAFQNTGRAHASIVLSDGNGTASNSYIRFMTASSNNTVASERMRILAGGGITFNGDTSSDNALNDYERGLHTISINQGGIGFHSLYQNFQYIVIGDFVNVHGLLLVTSSGDSNELRVNMPFTTKSSGLSQTADGTHGLVSSYGVPTGSGGMRCTISKGTNKLRFLKTVDNGVWTTLAGNELANGDHLYVNITYEVA